MFGNRMELEMEDEKVVEEKEAAPYAMYEAHVNRKKWELDNEIPAVSILANLSLVCVVWRQAD